MNYLNLPFWQAHITFTLITVALLGLIIGSFLNVVIYRLPRMLYQEWQAQYGTINTDTTQNQNTLPETFNLALPHSHCPKCQHLLTWWENIPLLSYLLLKGDCLNCKQSISIRYPIIELLSLFLSVFLTWHYGLSLKLIAALILSWYLLALALIDLSEQILPDILTITLLWLGLLFNINGLFTNLSSAIIGAIIGYLFLWSIAFAFHKITHKEGLGLGDCKLLAALGAWLGWQLLPFVVLIASVLGCIVGIILIVLKKLNRQTPIPFGPFLAIAGWLALLWGPMILNHYLFGMSLIVTP